MLELGPLPELPEVECLTRAVAKVAQGATLEEARFLEEEPYEEFQTRRSI